MSGLDKLAHVKPADIEARSFEIISAELAEAGKVLDQIAAQAAAAGHQDALFRQRRLLLRRDGGDVAGIAFFHGIPSIPLDQLS